MTALARDCRGYAQWRWPLALGLLAFTPLAWPQAYPARPIRLVIGSFPGGGIDLAGRIVAQKMAENLGQQVVVDNRGGANGIIGMEAVSKAAADGPN
jgi:tripartite-type tricarboxylate transporter receptor subunit TctC